MRTSLQDCCRHGTNGWSDTGCSQQGQGLRGHRCRLGDCPGIAGANEPVSTDICKQPAIPCIILGAHTMYVRMLCSMCSARRNGGLLFCPSSLAHCVSHPVSSNPYAKNKGTLLGSDCIFFFLLLLLLECMSCCEDRSSSAYLPKRDKINISEILLQAALHTQTVS